jgi:hypothetical protein
MKQTPKQILIFAGIIIVLFSFAWLFQSTNILESEAEVFGKVDPAFEKYVSAYTSGLISSEAPIKIVLAVDVNDSVDVTKPISEELFEFSPAIEGKAYWTSANTISFQPDKPLPNGTRYKVSFKLDKVMTVLEDEFKIFNFSFKIMPQNYEVETSGISYYDKKDMSRLKIKGVFFTADVANNEAVEKSLFATQNRQTLKITWDHKSDKKQHEFVVEDVSRGRLSSLVKLHWLGNAIGVKYSNDTLILL